MFFNAYVAAFLAGTGAVVANSALPVYTQHSPPDPGNLTNIQHFGPVENAKVDLVEYIKANFPPEHIVNSSDLNTKLLEDIGSDYILFVEDTKQLIPMNEVSLQPNPTRVRSVEGRQVVQCSQYNSYSLNSEWNSWTNWIPASSCLYTDKDPSGGSVGIGFSYSIGFGQSGGLSFTIIQDVIGASAGFSVTETYSTSNSYTCNVPGYSVGQVFISQWVALGYTDSTECWYCSGSNVCLGKNQKSGSFAAPSFTYKVGCNVGNSNVQCQYNGNSGWYVVAPTL